METLHHWFAEVQRPFPWRVLRTPYRVWISEVMLQQTRASVVVPYFERWMTLFPDIVALSQAPLPAVIKAWEGLGYYSRARNLHRAAQHIVSAHAGQLPDDLEALLAIPGIGPYTACAILAFGFQRRAAAVDGNVERVISRYRCLGTYAEIAQCAETLLHTHQPWVTAEALIELGATVCTPTPRCDDCPLAADCAAHKQGRTRDFPIKRPRPATTVLKRQVCVIEAPRHVLLQCATQGVMADLYEFPYWEEGRLSRQKLLEQVKNRYQLDAIYVRALPQVTHHFTRYKAVLQAHYLTVLTPQPVGEYQWVPIESLSTLPFSSGHRRLLQQWRAA